MMRPFAAHGSIVRSIWGDADTILFAFAGSAAEFALNRAVDWLFYTGKLPDDPMGRLFSTARFAKEIVFADEDAAHRTLVRIRAAHEAVERSRGGTIPDWAHRDVLYMLIDYSERAYGLLHRPLTGPERADLYDVFRRVGEGLAIPDLPGTYDAWREDRKRHMERDLTNSDLTAELYRRYRRHLGRWRYEALLRVQSILVPDHVRGLLGLGRCRWMRPSLGAYRAVVRIGLRPLIHRLVMPTAILPQIRRAGPDRLGRPRLSLRHERESKAPGRRRAAQPKRTVFSLGGVMAKSKPVDVSIGKFDILATYAYAQALLDGCDDDEARERGMVAAVMGAKARMGHTGDYKADKEAAEKKKKTTITAESFDKQVADKMGGFFEKTFLPTIKKLVAAHLSYEDLKRLVKIPSTWGAKISGEQFVERIAGRPK